MERLMAESYRETGGIELKFQDGGAVLWVGMLDRRTLRGGRVAARTACTAIGYSGRRGKPDFNYIFDSLDQMWAHVAEWLFRLRAWDAKRKRDREERITLKNNLVVGDILVSSWGYDQTNIDFYEVTRLVGKKSVAIRPLSQNRNQTGWMSGTCRPMPGYYTGPEAVRRVNAGRERSATAVKVRSFAYAGLWDGRAESWSSYA